VLLALVVFSVWEGYSAAEQATAREAAAAIALYRSTRAFPPAARIPLERRLRAYVVAVLELGSVRLSREVASLVHLADLIGAESRRARGGGPLLEASLSS
jgi:hypothetical protein